MLQTFPVISNRGGGGGVNIKLKKIRKKIVHHKQ